METKEYLQPRIPVSTYRVQFNHLFGFSHAREIIGYLHDLGISDIYSSPYFKAKTGSMHGYDIVDHNAMNPEVGSWEEYDGLIEELRKFGMGQILDFVPNHMAIGAENNWWTDVLENGPGSLYAEFFDTDWEPVKKELKDKVLLPVLGDQYGLVLEDGDVNLIFEEGAFFVRYYENKFPIRPGTYMTVLQYGLDALKEKLSSEDPQLLELLSIITGLSHLPHYTETAIQKIEERNREKEVLKKRLWDLWRESLPIREFINQNVRFFNGVKGDPASFDLLDQLLREQVYRLSHWRVATEEINYRRFFDINELATVRMENPTIYEKAHRLLFKLIRDGKVTGLRIDHPDGLYRPTEYFRRLQRDCFVQLRLEHLEGLKSALPAGHSEKLAAGSPLAADLADMEAELARQFDETVAAEPDYKPFYIVGEKILSKGERMHEEWPIFSTTGYVFLNSVNGIFIDTGNAKAFEQIYSKFIKTKVDFQDIVHEKKKLVMHVAMSSEINTLGHYLNRLSEKNRHTRDFTLYSLTTAIKEVIACFPVYRTYTESFSVREKDRQYIEYAVSKGNRKNPATSGSIFDFVKDVLLLRFPNNFKEEDKKEWLDFVMRFQQLTSPVMAKGMEDTTFYVYNRFVSLNEVGGMPDRFGTPLETFHGQNIERKKYWPHALITTATHDTKRGEDVRARINVLSEIPDEWRKRVFFWNKLNKKKKVVVEGQRLPDLNDEYMFYQTLIGAWPVSLAKMAPERSEFSDDAEYDSFKQRIKAYMLKATREAKVNTSWINPNAVYEDSMSFFIDAVLDRRHGNDFLADFVAFQRVISSFGMHNSLSQVLLKMTSPGVSDFYQGTELWDFSLVDPDNRRPVDFSLRREMLQIMKERETQMGPLGFSRELTARKEDGTIKLYVIYKALNYRRANRQLFDSGEYIPLEISGEKARNVCAFARRLEGKTAVVVVPRFLTQLVASPEFPPFGSDIWGGTLVSVPTADAGASYHNIFTDEYLDIKEDNGSSALYLANVFANFPVALLELSS